MAKNARGTVRTTPLIALRIETRIMTGIALPAIGP